MNQNLVPEVRLDKNGKPVTRHVRSTGVPTGTASLPAPSLNAVPSEVEGHDSSESVKQREASRIVRHASAVERIRSLCVRWIDNSSDVKEDEFVDYLSGLSQDTLSLIEKQVGNSIEHNVEPSEFVGALEECEGNEIAIRQYVTYGKDLSDCEDYGETFRYVEGLRHYEQFRNIEDLSTLSGDDELAARGLLKVALHFHCNDEDSFTENSKGKYVSDPRYPGSDEILPIMESSVIADLIIDHPQQAEAIYESIAHRGIKSPEVLTEMIRGTHSAVTGGFL